MVFELGLGGLGVLAALSLAFGIVVEVIAGHRAVGWLWIAAAAGWFVGGLVASEVVWGGLTEADIQPMFDGLAFDEALIGGMVAGIPVALVTWVVTSVLRGHGSMSDWGRNDKAAG